MGSGGATTPWAALEPSRLGCAAHIVENMVSCCVTKLAPMSIEYGDIWAALCALHQTIGDATRGRVD